MNPETFERIKRDAPDVVDLLGAVELRQDIPTGVVNHTFTADQFVNKLRAKRKRERQNKKLGRRR